MNKISAFVSAKTLTIIDCVKLEPSKNYTDSIIKGQNYTDSSTKTISITNICNKPFDVEGLILFEDVSNGGNFKASLKNFSIGANQTISIPVFYNGIYLSDNVNPNYLISINGNSAVYSFIVSVPTINHKPITSDIIIDLNNRETKILDINMFLSHFSDIDGDSLDSIIIEGDTSYFTLNNQPLVSGTIIPRSFIESGLLVFTPPNKDDYNENSTIWKAIDSAGSISN